MADEGLYSVDDINSALGYYVKSIGHPSDTIKFVGRGYDGKLMCEIDATNIVHGVTIHWSTSSMATFLGFGTNADFYAAFNIEATQVANKLNYGSDNKYKSKVRTSVQNEKYSQIYHDN